MDRLSSGSPPEDGVGRAWLQKPGRGHTGSIMRTAVSADYAKVAWWRRMTQPSASRGIGMILALSAIVTAIIALPVLLNPQTLIFGVETVGRHYDPFVVMQQFALGGAHRTTTAGRRPGGLARERHRSSRGVQPSRPRHLPGDRRGDVCAGAIPDRHPPLVACRRPRLRVCARACGARRVSSAYRAGAMDSVVLPRAVRGSRSSIATTARLAGGGGRRAGAVELLRRSHRCTRHSGSHRCVLVADAAEAAHMVGSRSALASVSRALPVGLHGASDRICFLPHQPGSRRIRSRLSGCTARNGRRTSFHLSTTPWWVRSADAFGTRKASTWVSSSSSYRWVLGC